VDRMRKIIILVAIAALLLAAVTSLDTGLLIAILVPAFCLFICTVLSRNRQTDDDAGYTFSCRISSAPRAPPIS